VWHQRLLVGVVIARARRELGRDCGDAQQLVGGGSPLEFFRSGAAGIRVPEGWKMGTRGRGGRVYECYEWRGGAPSCEARISGGLVRDWCGTCAPFASETQAVMVVRNRGLVRLGRCPCCGSADSTL